MIDDANATTDAAIDARLRAHFESLEPSDDLRQRIAQTTTAAQSPPASSQRRRYLLAASLATAVAVGLVAIGHDWRRAPPLDNGPISVAAVMAAEFETFQASGRELDVTGSDATELHAWFSARMGDTPPDPPARGGVHLAGGRLCQVRERRIAAYMYDYEGVPVSLYITRAREDETGWSRAPRLVDAHEAYAIATWQAGDWQYSAIAALPADTMTTVAQQLSTRG